MITVPAATSAAWSDNLVRRSGGHEVVAAALGDRADVITLLDEMLRVSRMPGDIVDAEELVRWVDGVLSSFLWLVLLLRNLEGRACGIAVCEYIAYDVDVESRVLKCKQFYVRPRGGGSLCARSRLLINAILEAARRSPKLKDVFIVTTGAPAHARIAKVLHHHGFRRIGTQHIGHGQASAARAHPDIRELSSMQGLRAGELDQLQSLARAFFGESVRTSLGPLTLDLQRVFTSALTPGDPCSVAYLAYRDQEIVGFIAARAGAWPLSNRRYLQSTFFYVTPGWRASGVGSKLFGALAAKARAQGLDGIFLGTSSGIASDRVCRLLQLLGYAHCGDVFAVRIQGSAQP